MLGAWLKLLFLWSKKHFLFTRSCARHEKGLIIMAENTNKNGLAVAGFVVALIGLVLSWIPLVNVFGVILCAVGFILALIGAFKKPRTLAIIGMILAIAGGIIYYITWSRIAHAAQAAIENGFLNQ